MPRPEQIQANNLARVFGEQSLQTNWQTVTLELDSSAGGATYPVLNPGGADSRFKFDIDAVLLGVGFSMTWITAAAAEKACVAVAPRVPQLRVTQSRIIYYQTALRCVAAATASQLIQRNPGFMFPPPLVKFIQAGTIVQLYGTRQADIVWSCLGTLYYVTTPDYLKLMEMALI